MTRVEHIFQLRRRYSEAMADRKWKFASQIYAQLQSLVQRELNAENRLARKEKAA
jgi:hypothetical protein